MAKNYSLPVLGREDISEQLETLINSNFITEINGIDWDLINTWKSQFNFQ